MSRGAFERLRARRPAAVAHLERGFEQGSDAHHVGAVRWRQPQRIAILETLALLDTVPHRRRALTPGDPRAKQLRLGLAAPAAAAEVPA